MRLDLETEVRYPSGERAGTLRQVVLDSNDQVREVVLATDELVSRNLIVPMRMLEEDPGGVLTINIDPSDLDSLEGYEQERLPAIPEGWVIHDDPVPGGDVFPATMYEPLVPIVEVTNLPSDLAGLSQGTEVTCLDGRWGVVDEVLLDEGEQAFAFVARPDAVDEHDLIVPLSLVQQYDSTGVLLNCTLIDLPTYTEETTTEHEEPERY